MKKNTILNLLVLALPLAVVAIAISPNSVTVIRGMEAPAYTTFAEAITGSIVGWCPPVTLLMTYALFGMAVLHMVIKKPLWMKLIRGASFVAACLAACPIMVPSEVRVIPNVFAGILLLVLWGVACFATSEKEQQKDEAPKGQRLSGR